MFRLSPKRILAAITLVLPLPHIATPAVFASDSFQTARSFDALVESGMSFGGNYLEHKLVRGNVDTTEWHIRCSTERKRWVISEKAKSTVAPDLSMFKQQRDSRIPGPFDNTESEQRFPIGFSRSISRLWICDGKQVTRRNTDRLWELSSDHNISLTGDHISSSKIENADSHSYDLFYSMIYWAVGRGVCSRVSGVSHEEIVSDGDAKTLLMTGAGRGLGESVGTWEFAMNPDADFLIGRATFTNQRDVVFLRIETSGTQELDGFIFPMESRIEIRPESRGKIVHEFAVDNASMTFDSNLFQELSSESKKPLQKGSIQIDRRGGVEKIEVVGAPTRSSADFTPLSERPGFSHWRRVLVINGVGLIVLALVCILYQRRKASK